MKIKDGFVVEKVGTRYLAVAVGKRADEFNALIRMNSTGAFIWQKLTEGDKDTDTLVDLLVSEYAVDRERAMGDVVAFLAKLREARLLDE